MKTKNINSFTKTILALALILSLTGCSSNTETPSNNAGATTPTASAPEWAITPTESSAPATDDTVEYPLTISHAFGETVLEAKPERIATISWGNQDTPLALGVVPVGVSTANYGVIDDSGLLPWTAKKFKELGEENPVLYNDTDGLNFEAISDSEPDVILAAYSGITQEEYDLLSQIAPVIAYPTLPWQTFWRDQITMDAAGMGMKTEGEQLVANLESLIANKVSEYPQLQGKTAAFFYFNPTDLGKFYIYLPTDPRAAYLTDLGMAFPESITTLAADSSSFSLELSAENVDVLADVDVFVAYGNEDLLKALQADALLGTVRAVKNGSVALIEDGTPLAASGTPSALSIPATIDEYLSILGEAANKVQ